MTRHRIVFVSRAWLLGALLASPAVCRAEASGSAAAEAHFVVASRLVVAIPQGAGKVRVWLAMPQKDAATHIDKLETKVDLGALAPAPTAAQIAAAQVQVGADSAGNEVGYLELLGPGNGEAVIVQQFELTRGEVRPALEEAATRPLDSKEKTEFRADLDAQTYIPLDATIKKLAGQIVGNEKNPLRAARKIYDWMIANTDYWAKDPERYQASPMGNAVFSLSTHSGDSADFNSLLTALARSAGIPTRMVYGSMFGVPLDGVRQDVGVHCWAEMWFPALKWQSADVVLADLHADDTAVTEKNKPLLAAATPDGKYGKDPGLVDFYFGGLDARRIVWSRGRDLVLEPHQTGPAVNALPKAYVEIDGREFGGWTRTTTYKQAAP